jgi:ssDNA-binding Zn-finger/Zn-ribbon topoisomerase 1
VKICNVAKQTDLSLFGGKKCPKCDSGYLTTRRGKQGSFIGCNQYPDCDYAVFPQKKKTTKKKTRRRK